MNDWLQMIEDCEARESRLSDWDGTFLDSIKARLDAGNSLTPLQAEKLDQIWERVTAKG